MFLSFVSCSCLPLSYIISCRNVTFHYRRSSAAYFGGMCSVSRGVGVNEVRFVAYHGPPHCQRTLYHNVCDCRWIIPGLCCVRSTATAWPWQGLCPRAWLRTWASSGTRHPREVYMKHALLYHVLTQNEKAEVTQITTCSDFSVWPLLHVAIQIV